MQTVFEVAGGIDGLRRLADAWHRRVKDLLGNGTLSQGLTVCRNLTLLVPVNAMLNQKARTPKTKTDGPMSQSAPLLSRRMTHRAVDFAVLRNCPISPTLIN